MRSILLPFFLVRLGVVVSLSFIRLAWYQLPPLATLVFAIFFLGWMVLITPGIPKPPQLTHLFSSTPSIDNQPLQPALSPETVATYQNTLKTWLHIAELQPTHRDVLLNIALLYQALGQTEVSQTYRYRAQQLDPNYSAFQDN